MADISKIQVPIDGVMTELNIKGSGGSANYYGTCTGQASNQIKAVTISNDQGFELKTGVLIFVKFDANNLYVATSSSPIKLNVNNTGEKQIYADDTATPTGTNTTFFGKMNCINQYMYNGTYWVWNGTSSEDEGGFLPVNTITYAQFSQMSDAEQLAFTGYVTDYPGIDDEPVADDVIYDNTDSGLTANNVQDAIDEVNSYVKDKDSYSFAITGFVDRFSLERVGSVCFITYNGDANSLSTGYLTFSQTLPERFRPPHTIGVHADADSARVIIFFQADGSISGYNYDSAITSVTNCRFGTLSYPANSKEI